MADMKKDAQQVSNMMNNLGFIPEKFCAEIAKDHRTIQQNFTRLCFAWIKLCASDEYRHDERNRATHVKCKAIVDTMSTDPAWDYLPYIQSKRDFKSRLQRDGYSCTDDDKPDLFESEELLL